MVCAAAGQRLELLSAAGIGVGEGEDGEWRNRGRGWGRGCGSKAKKRVVKPTASNPAGRLGSLRFSLSLYLRVSSIRNI